MSASAAVVVITPTVGRRAALSRALASVARSVARRPVRHIVVGDCLGAACSNEVEQLCWGFGATFVNDRAIRPTRYGPARASMARNRAVAMSGEPYIALLD